MSSPAWRAHRGNGIGTLLRIVAPSVCCVMLWAPSPAAELSPQTPPAIDAPAARKLADSLVRDLIAERYPEVRVQMERAYQNAVTADRTSRTFAPMFVAFGKPLDARFSRVTQGQKTYPDRFRKPMLRFWYDVRTTKAEMGKYLLWVDIVPDQGGLACTYLSIVTRVGGPAIPR